MNDNKFLPQFFRFYNVIGLRSVHSNQDHCEQDFSSVIQNVTVPATVLNYKLIMGNVGLCGVLCLHEICSLQLLEEIKNSTWNAYSAFRKHFSSHQWTNVTRWVQELKYCKISIFYYFLKTSQTKIYKPFKHSISKKKYDTLAFIFNNNDFIERISYICVIYIILRLQRCTCIYLCLSSYSNDRDLDCKKYKNSSTGKK